MRLVDDTSGAATQRVRRSDALVPGLLAIGGAVEMAGGGYEPLWLGMATYVLASGALVLRRAAPLAVPPAVGAIYALTPLLGFDISDSASWILVLAFACLSTGLLAPRSRRLRGACERRRSVSPWSSRGWRGSPTFEPDLLFGLILCVGSWALGVALRGALDRTRRLGAEAERVRIERSLAADRAAASERSGSPPSCTTRSPTRSARWWSRPRSASDLIRRDAGAAAAALEAVAQAGRHALGETGRLLRLLRDDRDELGLQLAPTADRARAPRATAARRSPAPRRSAGRICCFRRSSASSAPSRSSGRAMSHSGRSLGACWLAAGLLCARRALPLAMPIVVSAILVAGGLIGGDTDEPASTLLVLALAFVAAGLHVPRSRAAAGLASVLAAIALLTASTVASGELADVVLDVALVVPWAVGVAFGETLERARTLAAEAERARARAGPGGRARRRRGAPAHRPRAPRRSRQLPQRDDRAGVAGRDISPISIRRGGSRGWARWSARAGPRSARPAGSCGSSRSTTSRAIRSTGWRTSRRWPTSTRAPASGSTSRSTGVAARLPMSVELSTYRIVQEALTNVLKHAPGQPRPRPARARGLRRRDRGTQRPGRLGGVRRRDRRPRAGRAARAGSLFGGALDAGPTPDGGFVLAATLPVEEPA